MGRLVMKFLDHDTDVKQVSVPTIDNLSGTFAGGLTFANAIRTAVEAVTMGTIIYDAYIYDENVIPAPVPPASGFAQNHSQWLITLRDAVNGHDETLTLPTADYGAAGLLLPNSDQADMTAAEWIAVKDALEDFYRSNDGNAVIMISAQIRE